MTVELELIPTLLKILSTAKGESILPSLKVLGSIVKCSVKNSELLIDLEEIVDLLKMFLMNKNWEVRRESCLIIWNLAVHEKNIQKLVKQDFFILLKFILLNDSNSEVIL